MTKTSFIHFNSFVCSQQKIKPQIWYHYLLTPSLALISVLL